MTIFKPETGFNTTFNMNKYLFLLICAGLLVACKHKKVPLSDAAKVELNEFIDFFPEVRLPYQTGDSVFNQEDPDSLLISYKVFTKFIPDTVLTRHFPKGSLPRMYPLGRVRDDKKETYLFVKAVTPAREWVYLVCFDRSNRFSASKPLFSSESEEGLKSCVSMDTKYTITILRQWKSPSGELVYKKNAYVYNDAGNFMLILTESNEPTQKTRAVQNPIDTLAKKHRLSADYVQDRKNFISVRDGRDQSHILFFIHFEKDNGSCTGELKGEARMVSPTLARYNSSGDPCTLELNFTPLRVSIKEVEACGNHRDIRCFFDGVFPRVREVKKKTIHKHA